MLKALFWLLVILCFICLIYGLGSLLKRKSDGEDVKTDTIVSFVFSGLSFILSLVILFGEDEIKGTPTEDTTTPIVSISQTDSTAQLPVTTTPSTNPPPPSTTLPPVHGNIQLQGDTITGAVYSENTILIQPYKANQSGRYRLDFHISDVTNKYHVAIKNSSNQEIANEYSSSSGNSGITCSLNAGEEYQIIVTTTQYKNNFTFEIKINIPDN